jgi:tRNA G18 (ribose-2'-O)-methylase SpoU
MSHIEGDFNFGSVIRSANAMGANEVMYVGGKKNWDRRSAVGAHHYTKLSYYSEWSDFFDYMIINNYTPVALENNVDYPVSNLFEFKWPAKPCLIVGEEGTGLSNGCLTWVCAFGGSIVSIPDYGSVRSLNVASAATVAMYDLVNKKV